MTGIPPPRYRVVERGRRLEVIDARDGSPVRRHGPTPPPLPTGGSGEMLARIVSRGERMPDGRHVLRTRGEYDMKGPRSIALAEGGARLFMGFAIALGIVAGVIFAAILWLGLGGIAIAGVAIGMAIQHGRPLMTRLLDRLGETVDIGAERVG